MSRPIPSSGKKPADSAQCADEPGDLVADVGVLVLEEVAGETAKPREVLEDRARRVENLQHPAHERGLAGILEIEAAAVAAVELVRDADRARDDRRVRGVQDVRDPPAVGPVGHALAGDEAHRRHVGRWVFRRAIGVRAVCDRDRAGRDAREWWHADSPPPFRRCGRRCGRSLPDASAVAPSRPPLTES
jgi:hypothetical protein